MIRLGDIVEVTKMGKSVTQAWLVKRSDLKKYAVMGFVPGKGWFTANDGTLKEMRAYIKKMM